MIGLVWVVVVGLRWIESCSRVLYKAVPMVVAQVSGMSLQSKTPILRLEQQHAAHSQA